MRYKLTIEYDGTGYCGFQKQPDQPNRSIEELLENAIFAFSKQKTKIISSGRTDSGVHALGQVVHFDIDKAFDPFEVRSAMNYYLTHKNIAVLNCEVVDEDFHSRYCATLRHYRYVIINRHGPLTIKKNQAWRLPGELNIDAMQLAASHLIGLHDFSSFRDRKCASNTAIRRVKDIKVKKLDEEIHIEISAKSFLHHMVRNIVGTLALIGSGKLDADDMKKILEAKNRVKSGPNAPACGLYFLRVDY